MWVIIVIAVIVAICYFTLSGNNREVEKGHLANGGLRKSYPIMCNHLENFYGMTFVTDTGRSFTYSKPLKDINNNSGQLSIGIRLDIKQAPLIFTKYKSAYLGEIEGIDVSSVNFEDTAIIENCIKISIDKIKGTGFIQYSDEKSGLSPAISKEAIDRWSDFNNTFKDTELSFVMDTLINQFFIPDAINMEKYLENLDILRNKWKGANEDYGTSSVKEIYYLPPLFDDLFVSAYPDVYQWFQENANTGKIEIYNQMQKLDDNEATKYMEDYSNIVNFYRALVNQFKKEGNVLECREF